MTPRRGLASGMLAAAAAVGVSEALAAVFNLRESPVLALGQTVIKLTPGGIAEGIISVVGKNDKPLAVASVLVAILLLGGLAGLWWSARRAWSLALIGVLVVAASAAMVGRPYAYGVGVVVCVIAGAVVLSVLAVLHRAEVEPASGRRDFLRTAAIIGVATVIAGGAGELLGSRRRRRQQIERARTALRVPSRNVAVPSGVDFGAKDQPRWLTPNDEFYRIDTSLTPPLIDPNEWRLRIHGMVDREITLTYQDLLDRGLADAWITICCVSNRVGGDLIGNTTWGGVPIKDLLDEVGIKPGADALLSTSEDGWTCGTPLEALTDGRNALLALTMNGEPLPIPHGFPVRQVVPGLYGYVSATKWVTDWEITRFADFEAYWSQRGWADQAPIKTQARIDLPRGQASAGKVNVAGVAWEPNVGISGVEVRIDGGDWQKATLAKVPNVDTWVQWAFQWDADKGDHTIEARAINNNGEPQTGEFAGVLPDGATGYPGIGVKVV
ncbi:DMSO/TMAO reductase YedYZ molybdopterin-dependent catalytic subunit [Aeromicrobium panaciterrae]|uniref:DMSO/TMAO reductase YedYZ molybdopterin-dependent catalytic subunit n=1 Tax=Aeromicrobium panaciterrae TaxID=363861 RepID=A0ABU1ULC7_9ACTN|nr:molybdopterin-dependent oxidoreductase [Aeromicrobium panaciterrae]MDR7085976.1 DMSO/TMAO reductase YedYZ molybdopterin-dependent catalytic subunit [Aeromicrobium panaciterrae]